MRWLAKLALALLLISLVLGQLVRFPLPGQGGGVLPSDIAVVLVLFIALHVWLRRYRSVGHWSLVIGVFGLWSLFTLTIRIPDLGFSHSLIAFSYWARLTSHLFLVPSLIFLFQDQSLRRFVSRAFLIAIVTLVSLGFLQLFIFPNLEITGWDPHQFRLVSTWLDPNLFGGFLILVIPFVTRQSSLIIAFAAVAALVLTQSRTSLSALGISALLFSPLILMRFLPLTKGEYSPKAREGVVVALVSFLVICLIFGFLVFLALGDRALGLLTLDTTAQLRLTALKEVWHLAEQHTFLGVGYNSYQFAAQEAGLIGDFTIHSRAGADNSWLTLWVTTGILGVVLFALPWVYITGLLARRSFSEGGPGIISLLALFIHSQFINSFLYSHILITLAVIISLTWRSTPYSSS